MDLRDHHRISRRYRMEIPPMVAAGFGLEHGPARTPDSRASRPEVTNPDGTLSACVTATGNAPTEARDLAETWVRGIATPDVART